MTRLHRMALAGSLVAAPILLGASEATRKYVEQGRGDSGDEIADASEKIAFVAAHISTWHLYGYLTLAGALAWLGAVIAVAHLVGERRPVLGLVGLVLGLGSGLGWALHLGFYTVPLSVSAGMAAGDRGAAAAVWAAGDADPFGMAMVLFFIATSLLAHLVLGYGLWRAKVVPWWAAACLPAFPVLTLETGSSPWWGAAFLILLVPFAIASRRLLTDAVATRRREPALG